MSDKFLILLPLFIMCVFAYISWIRNKKEDSAILKPMTKGMKAKNWIVISFFLIFSILFLLKSPTISENFYTISNFFGPIGLIIAGIILKVSKYNQRMFGSFQKYWYVFIILGIINFIFKFYK